MAVFPEMPSEARKFFPNCVWNWWQALRTYLQTNFSTNGDIEVLTIGNGVIVKSPNGARWRITVNNAGTVITTAL